MTEERELRIATDWAFEPVGIEEIARRFWTINPQVKVRYDPGLNALVVKGPISPWHEVESQKICKAFLREHRDELFDPRVIYSPTRRPNSGETSTSARDTPTWHLMDEPMSEPSSQRLHPEATSLIWTPSNETHTYYVDDQLAIVFRVAVKTRAAIDREVQDGRVRFRISSFDPGAVEDARRRLDDLEAIMRLAVQPCRSTIIVGPEGPDVCYSIVKRDAGDEGQMPVAFTRLLLPQGSNIDRSQVGLLVLRHVDKATNGHLLPDNLVNPPVIKRTEADTIEAWKDYVFPGFGTNMPSRWFASEPVLPSSISAHRSFSDARPTMAGWSGTDTGGDPRGQESIHQRGPEPYTASAPQISSFQGYRVPVNPGSSVSNVRKHGEVPSMQTTQASMHQDPVLKFRSIWRVGGHGTAAPKQDLNEASYSLRPHKRELSGTEDPSRISYPHTSITKGFYPPSSPAVFVIPPAPPTHRYLQQRRPSPPPAPGLTASVKRRQPQGIKTRKVLRGGKASLPIRQAAPPAPSSLSQTSSTPLYHASHLSEPTLSAECRQSTSSAHRESAPAVTSTPLSLRITEVSVYRPSAREPQKEREESPIPRPSTNPITKMPTPLHEAITRRMQPALDAARSFPGCVSLEVQIGLVTVEALPANMFDVPLTLKQLQQFLNGTGNKGVATSTGFVDRLTTSPADVDHIINIQNNGQRVFEREPVERRISYEFHGEMPSREAVIIEIDSQGKISITNSRIMLDNVDLCFPGCIWDAAVILYGQKTPNAEIDSGVWGAGQGLFHNLYVEPGQRQVRLQSLASNRLRIDEVIMKRTTLHRLYSAIRDDDTCLQITEKQTLHIINDPENPGVFQAWSDTLPEMTIANRQWWEVSLVNVCTNAVLEKNQGLQPGETSQLWSPDKLGALITGKDEPPVDSGFSGGQPSSSSSTVSIADTLGIGGLLHVTEILVRNIDGVGGYNGTMRQDAKGNIIAADSPRSIVTPSSKVPSASASSFAIQPQPTPNAEKGMALVVGDGRERMWQSNEEGGTQGREFW